MPRKLLALMLLVIAFFALIDLTRAAHTQLAHSFGQAAVKTAGVNSTPKAAPHKRAETTPPMRAGILRATWQASESR